MVIIIGHIDVTIFVQRNSVWVRERSVFRTTLAPTSCEIVSVHLEMGGHLLFTLHDQSGRVAITVNIVRPMGEPVEFAREHSQIWYPGASKRKTPLWTSIAGFSGVLNYRMRYFFKVQTLSASGGSYWVGVNSLVPKAGQGSLRSPSSS